MNITIEVIKRLESTVPELKGKIQVGAVDEETKTPYAVCSQPEEVPIRTIHGIAGYRTTLDLNVYHLRKSEADRLKASCVTALDGWKWEGRKFYYTGGSEEFSYEYNIHANLLTFKIT